MTMSFDDAKKKAGYAAIDNHVTKNGMKVGVGSGSTIVFSVERLSEKLNSGELKDIITVCTSYQSTLLCQEKGITVTTLDDPRIDGKLDLAIDGADEFDENLDLIKGGGGAHTQEKIIDSTAEFFVVVVDERKKSRYLGEKWAVPIEVIPAALNPVMKALKTRKSEPVLRMAKAKMGPVVTDNGNFIIDANFGAIKEPAKLEAELNNIPGVVENGIFSGMTSVVYMGKSDGSVEVFKK
ncbi:MAG: ribose-5-phosphate isomerase RpiA [Candidatus Hodarchaeota archaeon]